MNASTHPLIAAILMVCSWLLSACHTAPTGSSLYQELGGMEGITDITNNFIYEIGFDENIVRHFQETNLDRFREKFIEQVCEVSGGPCTYSGDTMLDVHTKMNVTEAEFNRTVDLLVAAMNRSGIPHRVQNQLLARLAPTRPDIIYK